LGRPPYHSWSLDNSSEPTGPTPQARAGRPLQTSPQNFIMGPHGMVWTNNSTNTASPIAIALTTKARPLDTTSEHYNTSDTTNHTTKNTSSSTSGNHTEVDVSKRRCVCSDRHYPARPSAQRRRSEGTGECLQGARGRGTGPPGWRGRRGQAAAEPTHGDKGHRPTSSFEVPDLTSPRF